MKIKRETKEELEKDYQWNNFFQLVYLGFGLFLGIVLVLSKVQIDSNIAIVVILLFIASMSWCNQKCISNDLIEIKLELRRRK